MEKKLKLGILGLSKGNGHPYSWAAIFNGYDKTAMARCPFPVILQYLAKQKFPRDAIKGRRSRTSGPRTARFQSTSPRPAVLK